MSYPVNSNQSYTSSRITSNKSKQVFESKNSSSHITNSSQNNSDNVSLCPPSPSHKNHCKTDLEENDRLMDTSEFEQKNTDKEKNSSNTTINPFAIVPNKSLHSEVEISTDLIEPKLELPDYSEEETSHDETQSFMDLNDNNNVLSTLSGK